MARPTSTRYVTRTALRSCPFLGLTWVLIFTTLSSQAADRIILRDLTILSKRTVVSFNVDGVVLDDGKVLAWDRIKQATVSKDQELFDKQLTELGLPLLRIRQRLRTEDYRGAQEPGEKLLPRYLGRQSESAFTVMLAATWGRIASGRNEEALVPYLYCLEWLRERGEDAVPWPGPRRLAADLDTGICQDIPPLWTNKPVAKKVLADVGRAVGAMRRPWPPGVRIYYASLARAADAEESVNMALRDFPNTPSWQLYRAIAMSPTTDPGMVARLKAGSRQGEILPRSLALYWLGRTELENGSEVEQDVAMVRLMRVAALFGNDQPVVAAESLMLVMGHLQETGDAAGAVSIRREILERYGTTASADRIQQESGVSGR
ncbi:MAG: hypothetical protein ABGX07_13050 [Pirellulaceae bacterium]